MIQARNGVTPLIGAPAKKHLNLSSAPRMRGGNTFGNQFANNLHFEGPAPKTPVSFQGQSANEKLRARSRDKVQEPMQTALKQASMLMTIPLLLGVSGMSYLAGNDAQLVLVNPNSKKLDVIG